MLITTQFIFISQKQSQFIEKNNDALHASLEALVQESANPLIKNIFSGKNNNNSSKGKLNFISVGSKFKTQLGELMEKLEKNVIYKFEVFFTSKV